MKCIIYCFSGTGNTNRVCKFIAEDLKEYDYETEIFPVTYQAYETGEFPDPNDYDLIGLAYPGHAFNAPLVFNRFVKRLPAANRAQGAFIVKSSGEPFSVNNSSSGAVKRYLKKKGYKFFYEKHYLMPYNIMFRYPEGLAKQMYLYSEATAKVSAKKIAEGKREYLRSNPGSLIMCFLGKIEWFGAWFNGLFYKVDKDKCINCGLCVNNCPSKNISVGEDGKFRFGNKCIMCCRCTMNCPKDAISMGILNGFRVNKPYPFEKLLKDKSVSGNFVNAMTRGYYKKFLKYYDRLDDELEECGIRSPRAAFPPDEYAILSKRDKRRYRKKHCTGRNTD